MKKIFLSIAALATLGMSSCTKFLEVNSPSTLTEEVMYSSESEAYRAILGVYAVLGHNRLYGQQTSLYYGYNNDIEFGTTSATPEDTRRGLWDYTATPSNSEMEGFNYMYIAINRANECITGIENSPLFINSDPTQPSMIRHLYGEAKAIRALMYLELTRNWGDVPFLTRETRFDDDFYPGATNRDTIQAHVIQDLIEVEPTMYYASELTEKVERLNRGAVQGLIARLALTRGGWSLRPDLNNPSAPGRMYRPADYLKYYQIAADYSRKLIESGRHTLASSFKEVFYNQCQEIYPGNDDMLYEVAMALNYNSAVGHNIGVRIEKNSFSIYGFSNVYYNVTLPFMYSFAQGDVRRDVSCVPYVWQWNEETGRLEQEPADPIKRVCVGKWSKLDMKTPQGYNGEYNTGINWPIIRYADVLLMFAEAENELKGAPTDSARMALKEVRKRAFPADLHAAMVDEYVDGLTDHDTFFDALVNERSWEFAGESIRKYDLIRWNLLREKLIELKQNLFDMGIQSRNPSGGGKYANVPNYIYYKKNSDGTLDIKGLDQNMTSTPTGYTRYQWCGRMVETQNGEFILKKEYNYYYRDVVLNQDPMVYLYPIHKDVIAESMGSLKNYYGK